MKFLTSISPRHHNPDAQRIATESWIAHGITPITFNKAGELEPYPGVQMVPTCETASGLMKAPYVMIGAMLDHARREGLEHAVLINSDIALHDPAGILAHYAETAEKGLVFANRYDHNGDNMNPTRYDMGFDVFIIHRRFFDLLPRTLFCMGQTWWDYWIPYRFIKSGVPVYTVKEPLFLHHRHPVQYDAKEWVRMTDHFVWVENYQKGRSPQQVTNEVYRLIRHHAK